MIKKSLSECFSFKLNPLNHPQEEIKAGVNIGSVSMHALGEYMRQKRLNSWCGGVRNEKKETERRNS